MVEIVEEVVQIKWDAVLGATGYMILIGTEWDGFKEDKLICDG